MPLGASRINGISYVVSSAPALPAGQAVVATNINYGYQDYSVNDVSYVGPDSSNRPVFFFAYKNTSSNLRATLFRINDDGTITEGAEQSAGVQSVYRTVKCQSEYEGAGSYGVGTPAAYVYMCYENSTPNATFAQVASINQDALTCTFGTAVNISITPDADQPYCAYVGNSRAVFGSRSGPATFKRYSRSGTTLTSEGTTSADAGFRVDSDATGFLNNGTTQYRYGAMAGQNGDAGPYHYAQAMGTTNYSAGANTRTGGVRTRSTNLNNTSKIIGSYLIGTTAYIRAVDITWNASSAPTFSVGTENSTITDVTTSGGTQEVCNGHAENEAFVVYNSSSSTLDYRLVTASGTTLTAGSKVQMLSGLSNIYYSISAASAKIGTKTYIAGIQVRSSGAPYIFGYRLA